MVSSKEVKQKINFSENYVKMCTEVGLRWKQKIPFLPHPSATEARHASALQTFVVILPQVNLLLQIEKLFPTNSNLGQFRPY